MNAFYFLFACLTVYSVSGQDLPTSLNDPNLNVDEDQFKKLAEEGAKGLKEKCLKVSGTESTFEEVQEAKDTLISCFQGIVNVTAFKTELDEAKQRGAMEEVFGKYCKKKPELLGCVNGFQTTLEKCMEESEKETAKTIQNLTENLLDFMCYKDGDRVAMFIAEGGFECIESKKNEIQNCVNETFSDMIPKDMGIENLGSLILIDDGKCDDFTKLQNCVTKKLEGCENQTPANVVDSLFKYIKKSLPCSTTTPPQSHSETRKFNPNSGNSFSSMGMFVVSLVSLIALSQSF
nr:27 kDa hemolymph protein-like [Onthophagus taurus]